MNDPPQMPSPQAESAMALYQAGRLVEAEQAYRRLLDQDAGDTDSLHMLGVIAWQRGAADTAMSLIEKAALREPRNARYRNSLGVVLAEQGQMQEALDCFERAVGFEPVLAETYNNYGSALRSLGHLEAALAAYDNAVKTRADNVEAHCNRGNILEALNRPNDALAAYNDTLRLDPLFAIAHNGQGNVLVQKGQLDAALTAYDKAIELRPDYAEAHYNRGNVLKAFGRFAEALSAYDRSLRIDHDFVDAQNNYGTVLEALNRPDEALAAYDQAIRINPNCAKAHNNRGNVLREQGRLDEALAAFETSIQSDPGSAIAHNNLGNLLKDQGRLKDALTHFEKAIQIDPNSPKPHSNYLMCLTYDPEQDDDALFRAHVRWGEQHGHPPGAFANHGNSKDVNKTLRIGLVSGDLGRTPTGWFLESVLRELDDSVVQTICYSDRLQEDALTDRLRSYAFAWRSTSTLTDATLAEAIRADDVDILIDLAGHAGGTRLSCFALKPAPIQASWIGYHETTGLPAMDYILMDPVVVPEGAERWFTETVVRLPHSRFCYAPPEYSPDVFDPPALTNGYITFGSFNNLSKVNDEVVSVWAEVLADVPRSRMILKWPTLDDVNERKRMEDAFAEFNIASDRLEMRGRSRHHQLLAEYGDIDIALDPFPYCGGLTSCEALWMGVPIVTLPRTRPVSRMTTAFLTALQEPEWIAESSADYIRVAAGLADDVDDLIAHRHEQRERMRTSHLCDGTGAARDLETALRSMWQKWCE